MESNNSFTAWAFQFADGTIVQQIFQTRRELINFWTEGKISWKEVRKYGHRAVKVEVKIKK